MMRRALVTGITGFIGGVVAQRLLADGWAVDALVRPHSDTVSLPFANTVMFHVVEEGADLIPVVRAARPDVVFHLASLYLAEHRPDQIAALVETNVLFPALLAEAMAANSVTRLINTGTAWQQFRGADYLPVNLYAATKQAAEDLLLYYADARGLSVVTLRLFDTYGPGDKRRKLIQILVDAAQSGEALAMAPGEQVVDLTHVDDVASAFLMAASRMLASSEKRHECFLVSSERYSVRALVGKVETATGRTVAADFGGRPYRDREVMTPVSAAPLKGLPGWEPVHELGNWLRRLPRG